MVKEIKRNGGKMNDKFEDWIKENNYYNRETMTTIVTNMEAAWNARAEIAKKDIEEINKTLKLAYKAIRKDEREKILNEVLRILKKNIYDPRREYCATNDMAIDAAGTPNPAIHFEALLDIEKLKERGE